MESPLRLEQLHHPPHMSSRKPSGDFHRKTSPDRKNIWAETPFLSAVAARRYLVQDIVRCLGHHVNVRDLQMKRRSDVQRDTVCSSSWPPQTLKECGRLIQE